MPIEDSYEVCYTGARLLKMEEVKRFGTGGTLDPYIYKVCNSTFSYSLL